ncbi:MAG: glycosyl hydrolase family 18 protein [Candidatus Sulfotelmatobacter sp.]
MLKVLLTVSLCACALLATAQDDDADPGPPIVVGYFPQWGIRKQFFVKNLISPENTFLLDQINYSQGHIVNNQCAIGEPDADLNYSFSADDSVDGTADTPQMALRGNFHQLQELKHRYPQIKIVMSLEGNASSFAEAAQPAIRAGFVASCIKKFIEGKFADGIEAPGLFDGIDIDWEYPKEVDKFNFIALLGEFRRQLNAAAPNLLLTVAMGDNRVTYRITTWTPRFVVIGMPACRNPRYCSAFRSTRIHGIRFRPIITVYFRWANLLDPTFLTTPLFPCKISSTHIAIPGLRRHGCSMAKRFGLMTTKYRLPPSSSMQRRRSCMV